MRKVKCILGFCLLLFVCRESFCQSFIAVFPDTIAFGEPIDSSALSCWVNDTVTNITSKTLTIDVVRVEDDTATPGWTSAFCFQSCSKPEIDSVRCFMAPFETVNMAVHLIITSLPDSGSVLMKLKNADDPSEVIYQRFYGVSMFGAGVKDRAGTGENPGIYPFPVLRKMDFTLDIPVSMSIGGSVFTLKIFSVQGSSICHVENIRTGKNILNLDLPPGIYLYFLDPGSGIKASGKLVIVD